MHESELPVFRFQFCSFTRTGSETLSPPYLALHLDRVRVGLHLAYMSLLESKLTVALF